MSALALWAANALWPAAAIVARLKAQVPDLRQVLAIDQLDGDATAPKQVPAALVIPDALQPEGSDPLRPRTQVRATCLVVLVVRGARPDPNRNTSELGGLIPQVVKALQGWVPEGQNAAFTWQPAPKPSYGRDHSYFPLAFVIETIAG